MHSFLTSVLYAGCQLHVPAVLTHGTPSTYFPERCVDRIQYEYLDSRIILSLFQETSQFPHHSSP
jgi:hypothetical protein